MKKVSFITIACLVILFFFAVKVRSCSENKKVSEQNKVQVNLSPVESNVAPNAPAIEITGRGLDGSVQYKEKNTGTPPDLSKTTPASSTPPAPLPLSSPPHPELKGIKFIGKSKELPNGLFREPGDVERYWYVMDDSQEMGMMKVAGIQGMVIVCEGPVIYDMIISEPGKKGVCLRIKKTSDPTVNQGQTWDWNKKEWGPPHEFEFTQIKNISGVRVLKDPEDPTPIRVEVGIPKK